MSKISNFTWALNSQFATWFFEGKLVRKDYKFPIRSAVALADGSGVAIVEPFEEKGRNNAVVYNADGNERFRMEFPLPEPYGKCFDQAYYVQGTLTAFANLRGSDWGYMLDEQTGKVLKTFESR